MGGHQGKGSLVSAAGPDISHAMGCQTHFHRGPHQPRGCLQRVKIILGLHKCNYFLTVKELKLHSALQRLMWLPGENEFGTPEPQHCFCGFATFLDMELKCKWGPDVIPGA